MSEQHTDLLQQEDHMSGMQHTEMTVTALTQPYNSIIRLRAKVLTAHVELWSLPNLAIRIDVEQQQNGRPISRIYTVRDFDPKTQEIEVDFVLHGSESPAMQWLHRIKVGSTVALTGPRIHVNPRWEAQKKCIILADDTALPAVYAMLKQWPTEAKAEIFIATAEPDLVHELPKVNGVTYHLVQPEAAQQKLFAAFKQIDQAEQVTLWAACDRLQARQIREYSLKQLKLEKDDVRVFGYWKAGVSSSVIDEARVEHYSKLVEQGNGLKAFDDLDVQI